MTANAIDEWTLNAIPPGSGRYYAILHAHQSAQPRLRALATLTSIWSKLCFSNREIEVAQKKMDWWREELNREAYLHPVTCELQQLNDGAILNAELRTQLLNIHKGYASLLTAGSPATEQANQQFHQLTGATACEVLCHSGLNSQGGENVQNVRQAGVLLSRLRCLRHINKHINNGLMCLPMAELEARNIKPNQFIPGAVPPEAAKYLDDTLQTLKLDIEQCLQQLTNTITTAPGTDDCKSVYIYLQLQLQLLHAMQKDPTHLFEPDVRLAPLRNYWIALKAAARFDRASKKINGAN